MAHDALDARVVLVARAEVDVDEHLARDHADGAEARRKSAIQRRSWPAGTSIIAVAGVARIRWRRRRASSRGVGNVAGDADVQEPGLSWSTSSEASRAGRRRRARAVESLASGRSTPGASHDAEPPAGRPRRDRAPRRRPGPGAGRPCSAPSAAQALGEGDGGELRGGDDADLTDLPLQDPRPRRSGRVTFHETVCWMSCRAPGHARRHDEPVVEHGFAQFARALPPSAPPTRRRRDGFDAGDVGGSWGSRRSFLCASGGEHEFRPPPGRGVSGLRPKRHITV